MEKMTAKEFIALGGNVYEGTLDLRGLCVETLPDNLTVTGSVLLRGNKHITKLPKGLSIAKTLDLSETNITTLPNDLEVGDDLILTNSAIEAIPEGLVIGRSLFLEGTQITELPKGLRVLKHLQMIKTKITTIPDEVQVQGYVYVSAKAAKSVRQSVANREDVHIVVV